MATKHSKAAPAAVPQFTAAHVIEWARSAGEWADRDPADIMLELPETLTAMLDCELQEAGAATTIAQCGPVIRCVALLICMVQDSLENLNATRH